MIYWKDRFAITKMESPLEIDTGRHCQVNRKGENSMDIVLDLQALEPEIDDSTNQLNSTTSSPGGCCLHQGE